MRKKKKTKFIFLEDLVLFFYVLINVERKIEKKFVQKQIIYFGKKMLKTKNKINLRKINFIFLQDVVFGFLEKC